LDQIDLFYTLTIFLYITRDLREKKRRANKIVKLVQYRDYYNNISYITKKTKEAERVFQRENGAVGDHVGDCVFLGAEANLQASTEDSAQGR
jgi:hypothetical protein